MTNELELPQGTFECPICGVDTPHSHFGSDNIRWHQVYRPVFEKLVFEQLQEVGSEIYMMEKQGYYLAFPADQYRDQHGWGKLDRVSGEYHWPWVQGLWEAFKGGVQASIERASQPQEVKYGCHCDLEPHMEPDGCVLDMGRPQDCFYARKHAKKEDCEYWQPITVNGH